MEGCGVRALGTTIAGIGRSCVAVCVVDMSVDVGTVAGGADPEALRLTDRFLSRAADCPTAQESPAAVFCPADSSSSCCPRRPRQRLALGGCGFCFGSGGAGGAFEASLRLGTVTPGFSLWTATSTTLASEDRAVSRFIPSSSA